MAPAISSRAGLQPTYEELKPILANAASIILAHSLQPTYEELKLTLGAFYYAAICWFTAYL